MGYQYNFSKIRNSDGKCILETDCGIPPVGGCPENEHWSLCNDCSEPKCVNGYPAPISCAACDYGYGCCGPRNKCVCNAGFLRSSGLKPYIRQLVN